MLQLETDAGMDRINFGVHSLHPDFVARYENGLAASQMPDHPWRPARFFHLVQMFRLTRGVAGATAEAGCFRGLSSYLVCAEQRDENPAFDGSTHFIVDSFEGLSEPVEADGTFGRQRYEEGAFTETSVEHLTQALSDFPGTNINKGWIPEVFNSLPEQTYRFAHIDVDLYEPTLASLEYFYPRLERGGAVVIDDFGPWPGNKWPGCAVAVREFSERAGVPFASFDTGNAVLFKR
ncbi:MAG: hypothetical protein ED559_02175 [Phycisphaera sp.]|nr:MAG: hypothetical protein ED559_02175 [Phycisphaera sp.]